MEKKKNIFSKIYKWSHLALGGIVLAAGIYRTTDLVQSGVNIETEKMTEAVRKSLNKNLSQNGKKDLLEQAKVEGDEEKNPAYYTWNSWENNGLLSGPTVSKSTGKQKTETQAGFKLLYEYGQGFKIVKEKDASDVEALSKSIESLLNDVKNMEGVAEELEAHNPYLDFLKTTEAVAMPLHIKNIKIVGHASPEAENSMHDHRNIKLAASRGSHIEAPLKKALESMNIQTDSIEFNTSGVEDRWSDDQLQALTGISRNLGFKNIYELINSYDRGEIKDTQSKKVLKEIIGKSRSVDIILTFDSGVEVQYKIKIPLLALLLCGASLSGFSLFLRRQINKDRYDRIKKKIKPNINDTVKQIKKDVPAEELKKYRFQFLVDTSISGKKSIEDTPTQTSLIHMMEVCNTLKIPFSVISYQETSTSIKKENENFGTSPRKKLQKVFSSEEIAKGTNTNHTEAWNQARRNPKIQEGKDIVVIISDGVAANPSNTGWFTTHWQENNMQASISSLNQQGLQVFGLDLAERRIIINDKSNQARSVDGVTSGLKGKVVGYTPTLKGHISSLPLYKGNPNETVKKLLTGILRNSESDKKMWEETDDQTMVELLTHPLPQDYASSGFQSFPLHYKKNCHTSESFQKSISCSKRMGKIVDMCIDNILKEFQNTKDNQTFWNNLASLRNEIDKMKILDDSFCDNRPGLRELVKQNPQLQGPLKNLRWYIYGN